ncbi:hypothetical protein WEI85_21155 [Actinomycetes bacterium KLBMP 9797]
MGSDLDVVRTVISRVDGRQRRVRVVHPWQPAERPEATVAGGVAAGAMAVVLTCLAAPLLTRFVDAAVALIFGAGLAAGAVAAAYVAIRGVYAGTRNIAGKHRVEGVVVDRLGREYGEALYSVAVDDGSREEVVAWAVGKTEFDHLVEGTPVHALVSGDRRYLYALQGRAPY